MKTILFSLLLSVSSAVAFAQKSDVVSADSTAQAQRNSMPSRLSMTPTTTRQTQGQTFGEKVNQGLQAGGTEKKTDTGGVKNEKQKTVASSSVGGMSKPGGAVSSSYAAGRVVDEPQKPTGVKGEKKQDGAGEK